MFMYIFWYRQYYMYCLYLYKGISNIINYLLLINLIELIKWIVINDSISDSFDSYLYVIIFLINYKVLTMLQYSSAYLKY